MIGNSEDERRRLIPRWRSLHDTVSTGELAQNVSSPGANSKLNQPGALVKHPAEKLAEDFEKSKAAWLKERSIINAAELLSMGVVLGEESQVGEAASFILTHENLATPTNLSIARQIREMPSDYRFTIDLTGQPHDPSLAEELNSNRKLRLHIQISDCRRRLIMDCNNPVVWAEMALGYSNLGQNKQAERAMRCAYFLAPNNRYILRCMSRLLIHLDRPEEAQHLLYRNEKTLGDPWLMAPEISASSIMGKQSKLLKRGQSFLDRNLLYPRQMSELAGALATVALEQGDKKKARRLFKQSLIDPTENVAAQAGWASTHHRIILEQSLPQAVGVSSEAQALLATSEGRWADAVRHTAGWLRVESFSPRAAIEGSWLSTGLLNDPKLGEAFAQAGILANPNDKILLNNLAVALAQQNKVHGAKAIFADIEATSNDQDHVFMATKGLIDFRSGLIEEGREKYFRAMDFARNKGQTIQVARIFAYYLQEEVHIDADRVRAYLPELESFCEKHKVAELASKLNDIRSALEGSAQLPLL